MLSGSKRMQFVGLFERAVGEDSHFRRAALDISLDQVIDQIRPFRTGTAQGNGHFANGHGE